MVVARDMFLRFLVFCGVVGAVVGLAHVGAKHMGVRWFVIFNNGVFVGTIGLVPFFALEGIRCMRVLLGCLKRMSIFLFHGRGL
ncbi:hypothetical protein [Bartonella sp. MU37NMGALS]|uniref:hypothetical protein n=1 Tax=Bartonella sp. MU37NMGALS TaxID=3243560 RepID=UPI0035CFA112